MKFFMKTKGVISVFLIIIMLPLLTSAVILVDGTRYHSAKMMAQEAGDLAAYSTIANYNVDLKDEFGLFAIDDENMSETFKKYFTETLGYSAADAETYSQKIQSIVSSTVFGGGAYNKANFFNMYNFEVVNASATPMYPLSDPGVLQNQIVEYTKYRGIETLLERFEIISSYDGLSKELNNNNEKIAAMEDVSSLESGVSQFTELLNNLTDMINTYNRYLDDASNLLETYEDAYSNEMCQLATKGENINYWKNARKTAFTDIKSKVEAINTQRTSIIELCDILQLKADALKTDYTKLKERYSSQSDICEDIQKQIDILDVILSTSESNRQYSVVLAKSINSPKEFFDNEIFVKIDAAETNISKTYSTYNTDYNEKKAALDADETLFEEEKKEELKKIRYHINNKFGGEWFYTANDYTEKDIDNGMRNGANSIVDEYRIKGYMDSHIKEFKATNFTNYYIKSAENVDTSKIPESVKANDKKYASTSTDEANSSKKKAERADRITIDSSAFSALPSQKAGKGSNVEETNIADIDSNNASKAIKSANASSDFGSFLESGRNDILTFAYAMDMFKTRVTENGITSADKPSGINERNLVDWRYSNDVGELDLRYRDKKGLQTAFASGEIEYIFAGKSSESKNEAIVYSWIYGTRLANNLVAVYTDSNAKAQCEMLAAMSSLATSGAIPATVFKWVYIAAWAAGETALELSYLIDDGYKVPLVKGKGSLYIQNFWDVAAAIGNSDKLMRDKFYATGLTNKICVSYEDYLIILMCFVDRDTRLLRIADLIQLNMNKRYGSFDMNKSYTYLKADTTVRIKYMFEPVKQFSDSYKGTGLKFTNTIFQGY